MFSNVLTDILILAGWSESQTSFQGKIGWVIILTGDGLLSLVGKPIILRRQSNI